MALQEIPSDLERQGMLTLPNGKKNGGGLVTVWAADQLITLKLSPAKAELIAILNEALDEDQSKPADTRGWRSASDIISALQVSVEEQSLRKTVATINRAFRQAVAAVDPDLSVPPLLGTLRTIGIRLNWWLEWNIPQPRMSGHPALEECGESKECLAPLY